MAQRRPIASHPAFAPLVALWFAALFALGLAVLPGSVVDRALAGSGLADWLPGGAAARYAAILVAGLIGGTVGWVLGRLITRAHDRDPRPTYAETEPPFDEASSPTSARRPLRVREELADEHGHSAISEGLAKAGEPNAAFTLSGDEELANSQGFETASFIPANAIEGEEGFMILTPQPAHPPRPAPDLDGLLAQFDTALAAFRSGDDEPEVRGSGGPDPVHAFVARQTGGPAPSPLGGRMPDHQAELRAALDKLARAHRKD